MKTSCFIISTLVLISLTAALVEAGYADTCLTPEGEQGRCMPIPSCANIEAKLKEVLDTRIKLTEQDMAYLRQYSCGVHDGVHHVCCSSNNIQYNSKVMEHLRTLKCGKKLNDRVANGQEVQLSSLPWMALLKYRIGDEDRFLCGGTLITKRYVLTAAHCVEGREKDVYQVRLGEHKISTEPDCVPVGRRKKCAGPVEDVGIEKIIMHEGYTKSNIYDDIALLRLDRDVEFKKHIKPICLPITEELRNEVDTIETFYVSGWGTTESGSTSDVLLFAPVPNKARGNCSQAFRREIKTSQICAGGEKRQDSCKGDSGGPIQVLGLYEGKWCMIQYGVVSLGVKTCGEVSLPGIYTSVGYYLQWITDKINIST